VQSHRVLRGDDEEAVRSDFDADLPGRSCASRRGAQPCARRSPRSDALWAQYRRVTIACAHESMREDDRNEFLALARKPRASERSGADPGHHGREAQVAQQRGIHPRFQDRMGVCLSDRGDGPVKQYDTQGRQASPWTPCGRGGPRAHRHRPTRIDSRTIKDRRPVERDVGKIANLRIRKALGAIGVWQPCGALTIRRILLVHRIEDPHHDFVPPWRTPEAVALAHSILTPRLRTLEEAGLGHAGGGSLHQPTSPRAPRR
jgi:hypothetical protein